MERDDFWRIGLLREKKPKKHRETPLLFQRGAVYNRGKNRGRGVHPLDQICMAVFLPDREEQTYNGKPLMLQNVLFCPVLDWCARAWLGRGIQRFFIVCSEELREEALACFPDGAQTAWSDPEHYLEALAEFAAGCQVQEIRDPMLPRGNLMVAFHSVPELNRLQEASRDAVIAYHRSAGVCVLDGSHTYIDPRVNIGAGTVILPGTILRGETEIGGNCEIGPNALVQNCRVGDGVKINASQVYDSVLEDGSDVGPYAHIRPGCHVGERCHIGAFVQLKNCNLGSGTKMSHLTYVGDADVGERVNFGCGTITSNYDGFRKHRTVIGDDVFIGCNTNLVPPVEVGSGAYIAAGTTVTRDVPPDSMAIGRVRQEVKEEWAARWRSFHNGETSKEK